MMQADRDQEDFVDFIDKCIEWKPEKRMTPLDAFEHPWIQSGVQELRPKVMEQQQQAKTSNQQTPHNKVGSPTHEHPKVSSERGSLQTINSNQ